MADGVDLARKQQQQSVSGGIKMEWERGASKMDGERRKEEQPVGRSGHSNNWTIHW